MVANFKKCELCIIYAWLCVSHAYLYRYYLHRYRIFVIFRWLGFLFFSFFAGCGVGGALFTGVYKWYKWYRALKRKALFSPRLKFSIWLKKKEKKRRRRSFFQFSYSFLYCMFNVCFFPVDIFFKVHSTIQLFHTHVASLEISIKPTWEKETTLGLHFVSSGNSQGQSSTAITFSIGQFSSSWSDGHSERDRFSIKARNNSRQPLRLDERD